MLSGDNYNDIYHALIKKVIEEGVYSAPRGMGCYELLNFQFTLTNPLDNHIKWNLHGRQAIYDKYARDEHFWYLSGDKRASSAPSKFWLKLADKHGFITSNYGHMILIEPRVGVRGEGTEESARLSKDVSTFTYALKTLTEDADSRRAVIHYGDPSHFWEGNKDVPCTVMQQFFIRNNELHSTVVMRSNDMFKGQPYDVKWFTYVQKMMLDSLKETYPDIKMGTYTHFVGSLHVYERDKEQLVQEYTGEGL
jgi:thymidylate synthase